MAWTDNLFRWIGFGRYQSSLPTLDEGAVEELQLDQRGRLRVAVESTASALQGRYVASPVPVADGELTDILTDDDGRLQITVDSVRGDTLHDAADSGTSPVKVGGVATATPQAAVAAGDRVQAAYDLNGRAHTLPQGDVSHGTADSNPELGTGNAPPVKVGGVATATEQTAVDDGDRVQAAYDLNGRAHTLPHGDTAHDAVDSGAAPIKVGGVATATEQTAVAAGDRVQASYDLNGRARTLAQGDTAHDAADGGGAPIKTGGVATATEQAAVASGDRVQAAYDLYGRAQTLPSPAPSAAQVVFASGNAPAVVTYSDPIDVSGARRLSVYVRWTPGEVGAQIGLYAYGNGVAAAPGAPPAEMFRVTAVSTSETTDGGEDGTLLRTTFVSPAAEAPLPEETYMLSFDVTHLRWFSLGYVGSGTVVGTLAIDANLSL